MNDRRSDQSFRKMLGTGRALIVRAAKPASTQLARISSRCSDVARQIPEPVRLQIGKAGRRSAILSLEIFGGMVIVGALALTLIYGRLSQGPVSMSFVVEPIETAINGELKGARIDISDAVVRLSETGSGIEFRLKKVRVFDAAGLVVAEAPFASVGLSVSALFSGRFAARSVDFIGPKLLLHVTEGEDLALSFTTASEAAVNRLDAQRSVTQAAPGEDVQPAEASQDRRIALVPALNELFRGLRESGSASAYLNNFGLRDAELILARENRVTRWYVSELEIDLVHREQRTIIQGRADLGTDRRGFSIDFEAMQSHRSGGLGLKVSLDNVVPRDLGEDFPYLESLRIWDAPITASLSVDLAQDGALSEAAGEISLGKGRIFAPWSEKHPAEIDSADLRFSYSREEGRLLVEPAEFRWGQSRMTLVGEANRISAPATSGEAAPPSWEFALRTTQIALAAEQFGLPAIPLDGLVARGRVEEGGKLITLDGFRIQAADAFIEARGTITDAPGSPALAMTGEISQMPVAFLKLIWPKLVAPGAREWVGESVSAGTITGGGFDVAIPGGVLAALEEGGDIGPEAVDVRFGVDQLSIRYIKGMPELRTGPGTGMLKGRRFLFNVPSGQIRIAGQQDIEVQNGQIVIGDLRPDIPVAEVNFRVDAQASATMALIDHEPLGYLKAIDMKQPEMSGTTQGTFNLKFPLLADLDFEQLTILGRAELKDPRTTGLFGRFGVNGGKLGFNITERALHAEGLIEVNGVPVNVSWHKLFKAPDDKQPGLRLRAILDEQARTQLGFDVNHVIRGPVPIELLITPRDGAKHMRFQGDLTSAELLLINVAQRKPPGENAVLTFEITDSGEPQTVLSDFRVLGDNIAMSGTITLGDDGLPVSFDFPTFSPGLLTRLQVAGRRDDDNIWRIRARGDSYDGRQLFRSLFSQGKLTDDQPERSESKWGLDIQAEIGTVIGYFDSTINNLTMSAQKRGGKLTALSINGRLAGQAPLAVRLEQKAGEPRYLLAEATDAGAAFRLVGLYSRMYRGETSLRVNLDGLGVADQIGVLYARNFKILGDQVVDEVLFGSDSAPFRPQTGDGRPKVRRTQIDFDSMKIAFSVGQGQFILRDAAINGPLLGATMRGRMDMKRELIDLSGTYVPVYGLNAAIAAVPIIGDLLTSRSGEGVLGITFAVKGNIDNPQVLVNPVSAVAPGFLRQIFEFDQEAPQIIPQEEKTSQSGTRESSSPPLTR